MSGTSTAPICARCGAAPLGVAPRVKWWQGVPTAQDGSGGTSVKGDLCDPCHEKWIAEGVQAAEQDFITTVKRLRRESGAYLKHCADALREHGTYEVALESIRRKGLA